MDNDQGYVQHQKGELDKEKTNLLEVPTIEL